MNFDLKNLPGEAASLHVQAVLGIVTVALDAAAFAFFQGLVSAVYGTS